MTIRDVLNLAGEYPLVVSGLFGAPVVLAWILGLLHGKARDRKEAPLKYLYTLLVYGACIPGIAACLLTTYTLFFSHENILDVNLVVYFLPIVSMILTLAVIRRNVQLDAIPGFGRLSGLMLMIGISFVIALVINKLRFLLLFHSPFMTFVLLAIAAFALLRLGTAKVFKAKGRSDS